VPDLNTELIEAFVIVSHHVDVTVRLLVLHEVFDPLVERPRDVFLRRPIKAHRIEGRYALVSQFYPFAGFTLLPWINLNLFVCKKINFNFKFHGGA